MLHLLETVGFLQERLKIRFAYIYIWFDTGSADSFANNPVDTFSGKMERFNQAAELNHVRDIHTNMFVSLLVWFLDRQVIEHSFGKHTLR